MTYIIAEAGVNHDGSLDDALRLVDAAADAGADCVKFQTFRADALAAASVGKAEYQKVTTGTESQRDMLRRLELPMAAYRALLEHAAQRGIAFLSTPFDPESLAFLVNELRLKRIKVGSGDLTNAPMLLDIARAGCDVILSTGMATLDEVEQALAVLAFGYARRAEMPCRRSFMEAWSDQTVRDALAGHAVLLHCTTEYPAALESANLRAMTTLAAAFGLPVGYSDHTLGTEVALAAVALGATMIEKHLTLDRGRAGPDHAASIEPDTFRKMSQDIRAIERALGDGRKVPQPNEIANMPIARKSLVAACAIAKGEAFTPANLAVKRAGNGLAPINYWELLGTPAARDYQLDEVIEP